MKKNMTKKRETIANQEDCICEEEFKTVSVVGLGFSVDPVVVVVVVGVVVDVVVVVVVDVVVGVVVDLVVVVKISGWRICRFYWFIFDLHE